MRNVSDNSMNSNQFSGTSPVCTSERCVHPVFPEKSIFRTDHGESLIIRIDEVGRISLELDPTPSKLNCDPN
jgi:hypothetical protein